MNGRLPRNPGVRRLSSGQAVRRLASSMSAMAGYDSDRARRRMTCKNAPVVFEEIPPRPAPKSQRFYMFYFAAILAVFPVVSAIMWWVRWPHPLSFGDKILLGGVAVTALPACVFLLTAQSTTPSDNQERLRGLVWAMWLVQLAFRILEVRR